ncbi:MULTISPECIES: MarR family winged helix-turn-helix transcriptional regulator [Paenibacillus]|uniref:MarR family winged helix-turn-helix transcriptional regulator n=1 Tax=Paenibacillus TaxID=44249 RepID=UPI0022B8A9E2|nr:MarR family transcriptional regulator [Paenibacillus caseinilyticus]MCZ8523556.1 MarR family transcriptional regulator [Paenibacillus caseinilyticus]
MEPHMSTLAGYWLKITYRHICNYLDEQLVPYGITNAQLGVLLMLWEREGLTQKDLQEGLGIRAASLSHLMKGLEAKGLIQRHPDERDTRINRVFPTAAAQEIKADCLRITAEGEQKLTAHLSTAEKEILLAQLEQMSDNMKKA